MQLVKFIIIGAMKSGTTSLAFHLSRHPEVCFCDNKEPDFFSSEYSENKLAQYHKLYRCSSDQILGEASTMYSMLPENQGTAERIKSYNPEIKLIYIMRDPISRIESHLAHNYVRKRVKNSVEEEVMNDPSYINRSKYHYQITSYLNNFKPEQLKLLVFEDFIKNPRKLIKDVCDFLEIDGTYYDDYVQFERKNASTERKIFADGGIGKLLNPLKKIRHKLPDPLINLGLAIAGRKIDATPELSLSTKKMLYNDLKDDIQLLKKLMNRELSEWKEY